MNLPKDTVLNSRPHKRCRWLPERVRWLRMRHVLGAFVSAIALTACTEQGPESGSNGTAPTWVPLSASALYADDSGVLAPHRDSLARANTSCAERLEVARELADVAASPGLRAMVQACAESGRSFSGELRCSEEGSVEARCE